MDYDTVKTELETAYEYMATLKDLFTRHDPPAQQKALRVLVAFSLYDKVDQLWNEATIDVQALRTHAHELAEMTQRCLDETKATSDK